MDLLSALFARCLDSLLIDYLGRLSKASMLLVHLIEWCCAHLGVNFAHGVELLLVAVLLVEELRDFTMARLGAELAVVGLFLLVDGLFPVNNGIRFLLARNQAFATTTFILGLAGEDGPGELVLVERVYHLLSSLLHEDVRIGATLAFKHAALLALDRGTLERWKLVASTTIGRIDSLGGALHGAVDDAGRLHLGCLEGGAVWLHLRVLRCHDLGVDSIGDDWSRWGQCVLFRLLDHLVKLLILLLWHLAW